ncbi:MAG: VWA domain-containing protein [Verrucomicrobia bacterium]|nr:VWA domain-containing protein [Verrucomicrobiota bacterium]MCH8514234.1 VWA domain-containing protein [Kiritimatiellia bacterium]
MNSSTTELCILLDASSSMGPIHHAAIDATNNFLEEQKQASGRGHVSLVTFHSHVKTVHNRIPLDEMLPLTPGDYRLEGGTALYDALGHQIEKTLKHMEATSPDDPQSKVIFLIVTDGWERGSRNWSSSDVRALIKKCRKLGWTFLFLGAGQDLMPMAAKLGIHRANLLPFQATNEGIQNSLTHVSRTILSLREMDMESPTPPKTFFWRFFGTFRQNSSTKEDDDKEH